MQKQVATLVSTQEIKLRYIAVKEGKEIKIGLNKDNELEINPSLIVEDIAEMKWNEIGVWIRDIAGLCYIYKAKQNIGKRGIMPLLNCDQVSFKINEQFMEYTFIITDEPIQQFVPDIPKFQDFEFFKPLLTCVLCNEIFYRPIQINPCQHCFCGYCITQVMKFIKKCPICQKDILSLTSHYLNKNPSETIKQRQALHDSDNMFLKGNQRFDDEEPKDYSYKMVTLPYNRLNNQQWIQEKYIQGLDLERLECKSCKEEYNSYKCVNQQRHEKCCKYMIPRRELNSIENQKLKLFCQLCKQYRCKFYFDNSACFYNRNFKSLVQWAKFEYYCFIPPVIRSQIEEQINGLLIKFIIDDTMFTQVDKGSFYYESSYTDKTNNKEQLNYETPLCSKCFGLVYNQMIIKYFEVNQIQSLVGKPYCPQAFGCNKVLYQDDKDHAKEFNHYCKKQI